MARLFDALLLAAMASGVAMPALAHAEQGPVPAGTAPSAVPGGYVVYGAPAYAPPVYSVPVYSVPAAPMQGYVAAPQGYMPPPQGYVAIPQGYAPPQGYGAAADTDPRYREMVEKCQGVTTRHSGTTGAIIGGLVGGVAGNRIASGERAVGTVAGAAVGALAGSAIGKSVDKKPQRECDEFFASYVPPQQSPGYYGYAAPAGGYAYGYPSYGYVPISGAPLGYVMMPANAPQAAAPAQGNCTETRTVSYEYVPVRQRYIGAPPRRQAQRDKRVKVPAGN